MSSVGPPGHAVQGARARAWWENQWNRTASHLVRPRQSSRTGAQVGYGKIVSAAQVRGYLVGCLVRWSRWIEARQPEGGGGEKRARILVPSHPSIHPSIPLSFVRSLGTVEILRSVHPVPGAATKVGRPQPAGTPRMDPSWQGNDSTTNGGRRRPVPPVVLGAESESVPPVRPGGSATPGPGPRKASRAAAIRHILRWLAAPHAAVAHLSSVAEEEPFWWWLSRVERRL